MVIPIFIAFVCIIIFAAVSGGAGLLESILPAIVVACCLLPGLALFFVFPPLGLFVLALGAGLCAKILRSN